MAKGWYLAAPNIHRKNYAERYFLGVTAKLWFDNFCNMVPSRIHLRLLHCPNEYVCVQWTPKH